MICCQHSRIVFLHDIGIYGRMAWCEIRCSLASFLPRPFLASERDKIVRVHAAIGLQYFVDCCYCCRVKVCTMTMFTERITKYVQTLMGIEETRYQGSVCASFYSLRKKSSIIEYKRLGLEVICDLVKFVRRDCTMLFDNIRSDVKYRGHDQSFYVWQW